MMRLKSSEKFRSQWKEFCSTSTIHGLSDWYDSSSRVKWIFWALSFSFALSATVYGCFMIVDQYLTSPVVISYIVRDEHQKILPNVIICPFNRFNISYFRQHNISTHMVEYIQSSFRMGKPYKFQYEGLAFDTSSQINSSENADELDEVLERLGNITFDRLIDEASFACDSFIQYCVNSTKLYNCCAEAQSLLSMAGKCIRLNGATQRNSGFGFGMTIVIKAPANEFLSPGSNILHNEGVSLKLAEPGKGLDFDLTFIPTGVHALMPLRATKYEFMNSPGQYECIGQESLQGYSPLQCFDDCFFEKATEICGCRLVTASNYTYPVCKPNQQANCIIPQTRKLYKKNSKSFMAHCQDVCRRPCFYWSYQPTVSYAKFPSSTLFHYVSENSGEDWSRYIILDLFYEKLEYTIIKHFPSMTVVTFIANIGGQIGLWIGGSVLSLSQLVCLIAGVLWDCICRRACVQRIASPRKRKRTSHQNGALLNRQRVAENNKEKLVESFYYSDGIGSQKNAFLDSRLSDPLETCDYLDAQNEMRNIDDDESVLRQRASSSTNLTANEKKCREQSWLGKPTDAFASHHGKQHERGGPKRQRPKSDVVSRRNFAFPAKFLRPRKRVLTLDSGTKHPGKPSRNSGLATPKSMHLHPLQLTLQIPTENEDDHYETCCCNRDLQPLTHSPEFVVSRNHSAASPWKHRNAHGLWLNRKSSPKRNSPSNRLKKRRSVSPISDASKCDGIELLNHRSFPEPTDQQLKLSADEINAELPPCNCCDRQANAWGSNSNDGPAPGPLLLSPASYNSSNYYESLPFHSKLIPMLPPSLTQMQRQEQLHEDHMPAKRSHEIFVLANGDIDSNASKLYAAHKLSNGEPIWTLQNDLDSTA